MKPRSPLPRRWLTLALGTFALAGCAGGMADVHARTSRYPISLSSALPHSDGRILQVGQELEVVGTIDKRYRRWFTLYGVPGKRDIDISEDLNKLVADAGGQGVAELSVAAKQCGFNWVAFFRALPFWPTCMIIDMQGKIVSVHD